MTAAPRPHPRRAVPARPIGALHGRARHARPPRPILTCLILACLILAPLVLIPGAAQADGHPADSADAPPSEQAKSFIADLSQRAIDRLTEESLNASQRRANFRDLLMDNFDLRTIGRFVLGPWWRRMEAETRATYLDRFEALLVASYAKRFADYRGESLEILGAQPAGGPDYKVRTRIRRQSGTEPIDVNWRLRQRDSGFRVIDVEIGGVSMALTQRDEFNAVLRRGGIDALLAHLEERARSERAALAEAGRAEAGRAESGGEDDAAQ